MKITKVKVAVVGVGHLGKEHARIYAQMPPDDVELVGIADTNQKLARTIAKKWQTTPFSNYKDLIGKVDAVSVVVPTHFHHQVAKEFLKEGIHVMVEKPMTTTLDEAEELVELSRKNKVTLQVGHIERFNPAVIAVQKYDIKPKFIECHRLSPFSFRSLDIGVVLDLMIHDIDIILHLAQSKVKRLEAVGVNIVSDKEDIAKAWLVFENGCFADLTASRFSLKTMRKIRVFSEDSYISLDYHKRNAVIYRKSPKLTLDSIKLEQIDVSKISDLRKFMSKELLSVERIKMKRDEPLRLELESFMDCVRNGKEPVVTGEQGMRAIETAHQIIRDIEKHLRFARRQKDKD